MIMDAAKQLKLVKKAVKGNPDAYGELIAEYQEYMYKTAYLYVKNEEIALDAVGTAVLKAYLSRARNELKKILKEDYIYAD